MLHKTLAPKILNAERSVDYEIIIERNIIPFNCVLYYHSKVT